MYNDQACIDEYLTWFFVPPQPKSHKPVSIDSKEDQVTAFTFATEIPKGEALLSIDFDGEINDKMNGFYRSSYKDKDGSTKYMAVTQFEATSARYDLAELVWLQEYSQMTMLNDFN